MKNGRLGALASSIFFGMFVTAIVSSAVQVKTTTGRHGTVNYSLEWIDDPWYEWPVNMLMRGVDYLTGVVQGMQPTNTPPPPPPPPPGPPEIPPGYAP